MTTQGSSAARDEKADELRAHLKTAAPEMLAFMEQMKADFGAKVVYVRTADLERGSLPDPGVVPYVPIPAETWPYKVGESPKRYMQPKGRRA